MNNNNDKSMFYLKMISMVLVLIGLIVYGIVSKKDSKDNDRPTTEVVTTEDNTVTTEMKVYEVTEEVTSEETTIEEVSTEEITSENTEASAETTYYFRSKKLLNDHFEKHGNEFDYANAKEYEAGASAVINNPKALHKTEKEDGDGVYYVEATNEFVILSTDGYIRTYFKPSGGIDYYNRQ